MATLTQEFSIKLTVQKVLDVQPEPRNLPCIDHFSSSPRIQLHGHYTNGCHSPSTERGHPTSKRQKPRTIRHNICRLSKLPSEYLSYNFLMCFCARGSFLFIGILPNILCPAWIICSHKAYSVGEIILTYDGSS